MTEKSATAFEKAVAAQTKVTELTATVAKTRSELKSAKADLKARKAEVLKAMGGKPRGPRQKKPAPAVAPKPDDSLEPEEQI